MAEGRPLRADADRFKRLLERQKITDLWHFTPLCHLPCILYHGALFSIEELDRRGLRVPARESREDDIRKGVGDFVKTSTSPYWHMLSRVMRKGEPHVLIRLSTIPVLWAGTSFGDRNIWDNDWQQDSKYEFAEARVFVRREQFAGSSPPEIYVERTLPLPGVAEAIYTYLREETQVLESCLGRLRIAPPVRIMTAGEKNRPFPNFCHDDYIQNRAMHIERVRDYFATVASDSLRRGVEVEP